MLLLSLVSSLEKLLFSTRFLNDPIIPALLFDAFLAVPDLEGTELVLIFSYLVI
jgi:hypothetical protein